MDNLITKIKRNSYRIRNPEDIPDILGLIDKHYEEASSYSLPNLKCLIKAVQNCINSSSLLDDEEIRIQEKTFSLAEIAIKKTFEEEKEAKTRKKEIHLRKTRSHLYSHAGEFAQGISEKKEEEKWGEEWYHNKLAAVEEGLEKEKEFRRNCYWNAGQAAIWMMEHTPDKEFWALEGLEHIVRTASLISYKKNKEHVCKLLNYLCSKDKVPEITRLINSLSPFLRRIKEGKKELLKQGGDILINTIKDKLRRYEMTKNLTDLREAKKYAEIAHEIAKSGEKEEFSQVYNLLSNVHQISYERTKLLRDAKRRDKYSRIASLNYL